MSEEKLQSLVETYPAYSKIFRAVFNWFRTHPKQHDVRMDFFYTSYYSFSKEETTVAFLLMKQTAIIKTVYRLLDDTGTLVGGEFEDIDDIPEFVDTMWGDKKHKDDVFIVPYYSLAI